MSEYAEVMETQLESPPFTVKIFTDFHPEENTIGMEVFAALLALAED